MPHASLKLIPGVDQNRTPALNEAAISQCNLIRFMQDRQGVALPQKLGGWNQFISSTALSSTVRALHSWTDINIHDYLGIGTDSSLNVGYGGLISDISPQYYTSPASISGVQTVSGQSNVTITDTGCNLTSYDSAYFLTPISVDGIVLSGFCPITIGGANTYEVIARNVIGVPTPATTGTTTFTLPVFTTTAGSLDIKVTLPNNGYQAGSTFPVMVSTSIAGNTLYGNYIVKSAVPPNDFYISGTVAASSATSVTMNGGIPAAIYFIGQVARTVSSSGYGVDPYGYGEYGYGVSVTGGRQYAGTSISGSGLTATATLPASGAGVVIPVGSTVTISGTTHFNTTTTVKTSSAGSFTFSPNASFTGGPETGTVTVTSWKFVPPTTAPTDWSLDNWGGYLIACPDGGEIFYWNSADTGRAVVVPNAPLINEGCFVAMPERQIVAYGSTFTGFQDPLLVRWCDIGDFTDWVGTVANQAGSFRIPKGSKIVGGIQGPQQGLLWTDIGLWSMQYINQPLIYSFNEISSGCGLVGRKAAGTLGGMVYWMSQSQFFMLGSSGVQVLPCPIWDKVFQNIDPAYWGNVRCAPNSRFNEISWFYPVSGSNGVPTNYVKYNATINQWDYGTLTRTAWIDQGVFGPPIGASINGFSYPIYQHETSNSADGSVMDSYFETGYFAIQDGDLQSFVDQVWPDMKWGVGTSTNGVIKITFSVVNYPGDTPRTFVFDNITAATQFITPRLRGRLVSIRVESNLDSSNANTFWRLGNIRYRFQPDGKF